MNLASAIEEHHFPTRFLAHVRAQISIGRKITGWSGENKFTISTALLDVQMTSPSPLLRPTIDVADHCMVWMLGFQGASRSGVQLSANEHPAAKSGKSTFFPIHDLCSFRHKMDACKNNNLCIRRCRLSTELQ